MIGRPSLDYQGIQKAAYELFVASTEDRKRRLRISEFAANREQIEREKNDELTFPDGYYARIWFLIWIMGMLEAGATPEDLELNASDLEGILSIRRARNAFERQYPDCPNCGKPNRVGNFKCTGCQADLRAARR